MQSHTDIHTHPHTYTPMQWSDSVICSVGEGSDITWWPRVPVLLMISNDHWHYTQKQSWPRLTLSYSRSHPVKETWTLLSQDINGYSCFITHSPIHSVSKNGGSTHVYLLSLNFSDKVFLNKANRGVDTQKILGEVSKLSGFRRTLSILEDSLGIPKDS